MSLYYGFGLRYRDTTCVLLAVGRNKGKVLQATRRVAIELDINKYVVMDVLGKNFYREFSDWLLANNVPVYDVIKLLMSYARYILEGTL